MVGPIMNLTTHWIFGFAVGIGVFHSVPIALVTGTGTLIPDLDREYLFIARKAIGDYQLHRALFHNFFVVGLLYLFNPFLSLGALTHVLFDTLTSATDRGAELFFPLTRIVGSFHYLIDGSQKDHPRKMEWWVEDPWGLLQGTSDRDLSEPTDQPWRRSYGPFRNSRIVDWGVFFGAILYLATACFVWGASVYSTTGFTGYAFISLAGIAIFYGLGEVWRRRLVRGDMERAQVQNLPIRELPPLERTPLDWLVLSILVFGVVVFIVGALYLYNPPTLPDLLPEGLAAISFLAGLILSYVFVRVRKSADLAI